MDFLTLDEVEGDPPGAARALGRPRRGSRPGRHRIGDRTARGEVRRRVPSRGSLLDGCGLCVPPRGVPGLYIDVPDPGFALFETMIEIGSRRMSKPQLAQL